LTAGLVVKDIPASAGAQFIMAQVPGLQLNGVTGSLWKGRAGTANLQWQGNHYALGSLQWRLKPGSLLTLAPCAEFKTELARQRSQGQACTSLSGKLLLSDASFSGPAALMELWLPIQVDGNLSLQVSELELEAERVLSLEGNFSWQQARFHNSHDWMSLGSFAAKLNEDQQGGFQAELFELEGPMTLKLLGLFPYQKAAAFKGDVLLRDGAPKTLAQMFMALGFPQQKDGRYIIDWSDV